MMERTRSFRAVSFNEIGIDTFFDEKIYVNSIQDYLLKKYPDIDDVSLRQLYVDELKKVIGKLEDRYTPVKTAFGTYMVNLKVEIIDRARKMNEYINEDDDSYSMNAREMLLDYVIGNIGYHENFDLQAAMREIDSGIIILKDIDNPNRMNKVSSDLIRVLGGREKRRNINKIYINIDKDIAEWIMNNNPNDFLLTMAQGVTKLGINSGRPIEFMRDYLNEFEGFNDLKDILGLDNDINHMIKNRLKDVNHNGRNYNFDDKLKQYRNIYRKPQQSNSLNGINLITRYINEFGLCDSEIKKVLRENRQEYNPSDYKDKEASIRYIALNYNDNIEVNYNKDLLSEDDIIKAKKEVKELADIFNSEEGEYGIRKELIDMGYISNIRLNTVGLKTVCEGLNINYNSVMSKLLSDNNFCQSIILAIAERNRYKLGFFEYMYPNLEWVNSNKYSTKHFLRNMINEVK